MGHTILFIGTHDDQCKTYADYRTFNDCIDGICKIYEEHLKQVNPETSDIQYEVGHLFQFIDQLPVFCCFVYEEETKTYAPYFKPYLIEKIYAFLEEASGATRERNIPSPERQDLMANHVPAKQTDGVSIFTRTTPAVVPVPAPRMPISERFDSQTAKWQRN